MICLIDLDDVLVDFTGAAHRYHNLPYDPNYYPYELGKWDVFPPGDMTAEVFWNFPEHFWTNLPWTKEGSGILDLAEELFGEENVYICSCPTLSPASASGKILWIQAHIPEYARKYILTPQKWLCAKKGTMLIDDADHNIDAFKAAGGLTLLVPRPWNCRYPLANEVLKSVKEILKK